MSSVAVPQAAKSARSPSPSGKKGKKWWYASGAVLALAAIGSSWALWPSRVKAPALNAPPAELIKFVASGGWNKLSNEERQKYFDQFEKAGWAQRALFFTELNKQPEEVREKAMTNFMTSMMDQRAKEARKYVDMSPEAKKKELDRIIDEQEKQRAGWGGMGGGGQQGQGQGQGRPGGGGPPRGMMTPERMKAYMENTSPMDRAAMAKFVGDMMQRRMERGLGGPGGRK